MKALGGGRWRWTRRQSTEQTDIEFAMNQVDFEYCSSMINQIDLDNILPTFNVCSAHGRLLAPILLFLLCKCRVERNLS